MQERKAPIKVLQIVGSMDRGGTETWLMHVLRHLDRRRFQMDFIVEEAHKGDYDDEILAQGAKLIYCPVDNLITYRHQFLAALRAHGPYDVVHSHIHNYSGYTLWLAYQAGVPKRIAHSHNDTTALDQRASWRRKLYLRTMRGLIDRYATLGLAASGKAAAALYGPAWEQDQRWRVHYCSIAMTPFQQPRAVATKTGLRQALHLPADAFVVGHVGRFVEQKNHRFLLQIAAAVLASDPDVYFLLVGDGPLRPAIQEQAQRLGIADRVRFTGVRADIPILMAQAMDLFLLPSLHEGLCIVGMEAQAAGLPLVLADTVTREVAVVDELVSFLALTDPPALWAERLLTYKQAGVKPDRAAALAQMVASPFNIEISLNALEQLYSA